MNSNETTARAFNGIDEDSSRVHLDHHSGDLLQISWLEA